MAYTAIVTRLTNVRPCPDADRVQLATCCGNQVVIGLDGKNDDLVVYFATDGVLSHEFCYNNNLYRIATLNKDPNVRPGMFDENRRVRTQKFRKEISDGFAVGLDHFTFTNSKELVYGFEFESLNGIPICKKYVNQATIRMARETVGKKTKKSKLSVMFKEHFDTGQFGRNQHVFERGQSIIITSKLHGCVHMSTIIDTLEHGEMTIKEIVDNRLDVKIKAYDIDTDEIIYVSIDDWYFIEDDGEWYDIELEDGIILTITGNNPIWLPELKCYRSVDSLVGGETVLVD